MKKLLFSIFAAPWLLMLCAAIFLSNGCRCTDPSCLDEPCEDESDWRKNFYFVVIDDATGKNLFGPVLDGGIHYIPDIEITDEKGEPAKAHRIDKAYNSFLPLDTFAIIGKKYSTIYYITLPDGDVDTLSFDYEYQKVCTSIDKLVDFKATYNGKSFSKKRPASGVISFKKFN